MNMNVSTKIIKLRDIFDDYGIDCFLIPSNDEFQSEYVPEHLNRLKFITGFTGSNGLAVITKNSALFFTDSRYILQAHQELSDNFKVYNLSDLSKHIPKNKIGYDPKIYSLKAIEYYKDYNLVPCDNLVDLIWGDKSALKQSEVFEYPLEYAGKSSDNKRKEIQDYLVNNKIDALIITDSSSICWLLNIRAHDVAYNPMLLSYLIFHQNGSIELFSNAKDSYSLEDFPKRVKSIKNKQVQIDPNSASTWLANQLDNPILADDPCLLKKSCKNDIEIDCAKEIHLIDGVAVTKLLHWLDNNAEEKNELSISCKLLEYREKNDRFIYPSFTTISAFAANGAIIHYAPNEKTNKTLSGSGLFLLDSGGQYYGGTTDVTRVVPIGNPTQQQKKNFTLVLKGHIALARAIFPKGTSGAELDILARQFLWQEGKDYAHGTGHGVGNCLSVHEGPQRISKHSKVPLKPGMILSNEPGYYKDGEYGIRIENLMLVKELNNGYLAFETLTLVPIDKRLILPEMLNLDEQQWLDEYHKKVYQKLSPFLSEQEKSWLLKDKT